MKVVMHIGGAKCGSSAIQDFLRDNAASLKQRGVLIPSAELDSGSNVVGHQVWFFEHLLNESNASEIVYERLKSLLLYMQESQLHTLLISAENLINDNGFHEMLACSRGLFDVQVIAYVRRQDDYLASAWQQWFSKVYPSLQAYIGDRLGKEANWAHLLAGWEERFGRERMTVRRFQRSTLVNGDIIDDFLALLVLPPNAFSRQAGPSNLGFDESLGSLAHRVRDLFSSEHDDSFYVDMQYAIGPRALKSYRGSTLFSLEERRRILAAYEECNRILREKYFGALSPSEPLFEEPCPADVVSVTELEQVRRQQDLLVRAILGLSRRLRGLEMLLESQFKSGPGAFSDSQKPPAPNDRT